jgi:hypothetical protein
MLNHDRRHVFAARCPVGHRPPQRRTAEELRDPAVQFYCELCEREWTPAAVERIRALAFAESSDAVDAAEAPLSAA